MSENRYELSDRLRRMAHDLERAGFEGWPHDLQEIAARVDVLESRIWALEALERKRIEADRGDAA